MGLAIMILGLAAFLGGHAFETFRAERKAAIARLGEGPYKGAFSGDLIGLRVFGS